MNYLNNAIDVDENILSVQFDILGVLCVSPKYFDTTVLKKDFFDKPYDVLFEAMLKSYKKSKTVNIQEVIIEKGVDMNLLSEIISLNTRSDRNYFVSLERMLIDHWKEKGVAKEFIKLKNRDITIETFYNNIREYEKLQSNTKERKYGKKKIHTFIEKKEKELVFRNFKTLQKYSNVVEHDLVVIGGKTGTGKTGFALNLMHDFCENYPVLYINIELSEDKITHRNISMCTGIKMDYVKKIDTLPQRDLEKVYKYADWLEEKNIEIETGSQNIESISRLIAGHDQENHYIVIIDHIGRIANRNGKNAYEKATDTATKIRDLCLDCNCTIFGLCQLSREAKKAEQPSLDLLRDSGEIEQSARKVWFVWEDGEGTEDYYIYIKKNDSGFRGKIPVTYIKETQKFIEGHIEKNENKKDVRS